MAAVSKPTPQDWRAQQAIVLQQADAAVVRLLKRAQRDINAQLREVRGRPAGIGRDVREAQLNLIRRNLSQELAKTWRELGDLVQARRAEAAARAIDYQRQVDVFTLQAHNVPGGPEIARQIAEAEAARSSRGLDLMMARVSGASYVPLSRRVYNSSVAIQGQVDRMVNSALARGLSADEFARELEPFINPNTPGGIRYAALRLARSEINNAAHAQAVSAVQNQSWIKRMKWNLSGSHTPDPKEICERIARGGPNGDGTYPKNAVPMKPHPHCFCWPTAVEEDDDDDDAFLDALVASQGQTAAPAPSPEPPAPPVRPTPVGATRPTGSQPTSQASPPRPGAAPAPSANADRERFIRNLLAKGDFGAAVTAVRNKYGIRQVDALKLVMDVKRKDAGNRPAIGTASVGPSRPPGTRQSSGQPTRASGGVSPIVRSPRLSAADRDRINQVRGAHRDQVTRELEQQYELVPNTLRRLDTVQIATHQDRVQAGLPDALAWYYPNSRQIYLGNEIFEDRYETQVWAQERATNWCSRTGHGHSGGQAVLAHEFGHHVSYTIQRLSRADREAFWAEIADAFGVAPPQSVQAKDLKYWVRTHATRVRNHVSKYGATDQEEFLAEIWQEYSTSGQQSRPAILRIGRLMQELAERGAQA